MASSTVKTFTVRLLPMDWRTMSTLGNACAWASTSFSMDARCSGVRFMVTKTTCESTPCSAWDSRSAATKAGLAV